MIQPSLRNVLDRVAHPLKSEWKRDYDDTNYKAAFQVDQFQASSDPASKSLAELGAKFYGKIESGEITDNRALLGIAQALTAGIPAGPVTVALASVGKDVIASIMQGRDPKRGGFDNPRKIAEAFLHSAAETASADAHNLTDAVSILQGGVHSDYNRILLAKNALELIVEGPPMTADQGLALLARNTIHDSGLSAGDIQNVGLPAFTWLTKNAKSTQAQQESSAALQDYQQRKDEAYQAMDKEPWWVESSSALGRLQRENETRMVGSLEQIYNLSGSGTVPASQAPGHRAQTSSECVWEAQQILKS